LIAHLGLFAQIIITTLTSAEHLYPPTTTEQVHVAVSRHSVQYLDRITSFPDTD
jgi:hypothetical protein